MANSRLNVANSFVSEYFKNRSFWTKLDIIYYFQSNSHFSVKNNSKDLNRWLRILVVHEICGLFGMFLKMWRMDILIRHICGERKNLVGHR